MWKGIYWSPKPKDDITLEPRRIQCLEIDTGGPSYMPLCILRLTGASRFGAFEEYHHSVRSTRFIYMRLQRCLSQWGIADGWLHFA